MSSGRDLNFFLAFYEVIFIIFLHSKRLLSSFHFLWAAVLNVYVFVSHVHHLSSYVYCPLVGLTSVVLTGVIHQCIVGITPAIMS